MKNGLGALDRALDTLKTYATEDGIPLNDPEFIESIVEEGKQALEDVRALVSAANAVDAAPTSRDASDALEAALDNLVTAREGAHVS